MTRDGSIVRATWLALLAPKRSVPIIVVCAPLVVAQATWSRDPLAIPLAALMCLSFVAIAPVAYRVLFPDGLDLSHGAVRLVLYALTGAGVMLSVGAGIPKLLRMQNTFLTDRTSLAVEIALFLVGGWGLARDIGFEQRVERLTFEAERARLLSLRAHLDPHFLFNTLNAIAEWCRTDGAVAEAAVLKLSAMLRTVLTGTQAPLWPLAQELALVETLLELHLMRDAELFKLERVVPTPVPAVELPPLVLLTLAENAVKHGPGKGHRGALQLRVEARGDVVVISIENPGLLGARRAGGLGLETVERQLRLAFGTASTVELSAHGERTRATVTVPTRASA